MADKLEPNEPDNRPEIGDTTASSQLLFDSAGNTGSTPDRTLPKEREDSMAMLPPLMLVDNRPGAKDSDKEPPDDRPVRRVDNFARTTLTYPKSGRVVELDGRGVPVKINESDGTSWALTGRNAGEWTNNSGETHVLRLVGSQYSYTDSDKSQVTYKSDGEVERAFADGTAYTTRGDLLTSATGADKKKISFNYKDGILQSIDDSHGTNWQRKPGSDNEWTVAGNGSKRDLTGNLEVSPDGAYIFTGSGPNKGLTINHETNGTSVELTAGGTIVRAPDGSSLKMENATGSTGKWQSVTTYDTDGKATETLSLKKLGATPHENQWQSDTRGELTGRLQVSPDGQLRSSKRNPDGSVVEEDRQGRTTKVSYPDGGSRSFAYDQSGQIRRTETVPSEGGKSTSWTRIGQSDWWESSRGQASQRHNVNAENGSFSFTQPDGLGTKFDTKGLEYIFRQKTEPSLAKEKDLLEQTSSDLIKDRKQAQAFKEDMRAFEARAQERGLGDQEIARSYSQLLRLMLPKSGAAVPQDARLCAAQQAMRQAADPTCIDQGSHPTCNVATVESYTYTKAPAKALEVVAAAATTGSVVTKDGSIIDMQPAALAPEKNSDSVPPPDGTRSFASQLFQMAAVNTHWQRQTAYDGQKMARGTIAYHLNAAKPTPGDDGARLIHTGSGKPLEADSNPHVGSAKLPEIYEQLTGLRPGTMVLTASGTKGPGVIDLDGSHMMAMELTRLAKSGDLPVILSMYPDQPPFNVPLDAGEHTSHVLLITGYKNGHALVDNQWGRGNDFLGRKREVGGKQIPENPHDSKPGGIPVKQLYEAALPPLLRPVK